MDRLEQSICPIRIRRSAERLGTYQLDVTKRIVLAYAASIGCTENKHLDDARPGGIIAPPAFLVSVEWPVFIQPDYLSALGRDAGNAFHHLVHGFQDSVFHRPIRPGQQLSVSGRIVSAKKTGAGTLIVTHVESRDLSDNGLVGQSWFGSMYMRTPIESGEFADPPYSDLLELPAWDGENGDSAGVIETERTTAHIYTECARIWNPVHTERAYALGLGLKDIILHGTYSWARALQLLASHYGLSERNLPFSRYGARFCGMVIPGDRLVVTARQYRPGRLQFRIRNDRGETVLDRGIAEFDPEASW